MKTPYLLIDLDKLEHNARTIVYTLSPRETTAGMQEVE